MCKYKINIPSDGKLTPINMFKTLLPDTKSTNLNYSMDMKTVLHAYNNSSIPQMGVCMGTIVNKDINF